MPHLFLGLRDLFPGLGSLLLTVLLASAAIAGPQSFQKERSALEISTTALPLADVDLPYSEVIEVFPVDKYVRWRAIGRLPPGLRLDRWTGRLSGVPRRPGEYEITIEVVDRKGNRYSRDYEFYVLDYIKDRSKLPPTPRARSRDSHGSASMLPNARTLSAAVPIDPIQTAAGKPDLSELLDILESTAEGDWVRVNLNFYQDVWAPPELQPLKGKGPSKPNRIISAWSSFAWDSNRGDLVIYGGGHANSTGNDVYRWRGTTRRWERVSVPSEKALVAEGTAYVEAIDGAENAPASAHTYDNSLYLPIFDRFVTFGGAAVGHGGPYMTDDPLAETGFRRTGPYLLDLSKADPDKVGGTTGSHVQRVAPYPEILGGEMWSNRDAWGFYPADADLPGSFINGATGYAEEGGKDVVYVSARPSGTAASLYKVTFNDLDAPELDVWERVGRSWNGNSRKGSGAFDPVRNIFVRTTGAAFIYWDLDSAGPRNRDIGFTPVDLSGEFDFASLEHHGMDYDPIDGNFVLWGGGGTVWVLEPPAGKGPDGWSLIKQPIPRSETPNGDTGTGVLGKWKYIAALDAFLALQDQYLGNIWLYKPVGWERPGAQPPADTPSISLVSPADGAVFAAGEEILLAAQVGGDANLTLSRVEFYVDGELLGQVFGAPFQFSWREAMPGAYEITAVAVDPVDGDASVAIGIEVTAQLPPSVVLMGPGDGSTFTEGESITLTAVVSDDANESVTGVQFYVDGAFLGQIGEPPYQYVWPGVAVGSYEVIAVVIDPVDGNAQSAVVNLVVEPLPSDSGVITLRDGNGGYVGTRDSYIDGYSGKHNSNYGSRAEIRDRPNLFSGLVRFAVFSSEGGPIPDGAEIQRATLSLYKFTQYNQELGLYRVQRDWLENEVTWNHARVGVPWGQPGALGGGSDIMAIPDATAEVGWSPDWVRFDVTAAVQEMAQGAVNYGWKIDGISGNRNTKRFHSRESTADSALRPTLVIEYTSGPNP